MYYNTAQSLAIPTVPALRGLACTGERPGPFLGVRQQAVE
jgi:hypothetical protein